MNASIVSDCCDKDSKVIVSLTSYPARIGLVHSVLKTLYAQTKKPDRIILWLAEEQFPKREEDLPSELVEDVISGKLDLRWCDDLGSHKKYYYAMQEYPDDIIIIVDDDAYYHPNTIETLYRKHLAFPECVAGLYTKLLLIDEENIIRPCREWPSGICLDHPSMQLVPIGVGGVLYPPHSIDPCVFNKKDILANCNFNGVICGDDNWLKAHAILAGTPTVTQEYRVVEHEEITTAQSSPNTIHMLDPLYRHQVQIFEYLLNRKGSYSDKTVRELLLDAKTKEGFLDRNTDSVINVVFTHNIENMRARVNANKSMETGGVTIAKGDIHFRISSFCDAMAYSNAAQTSYYLEHLQSILRSLPNIDAIMDDSIYVRALMDYSAILLNRIHPWHKFPKTYLQMLTNWREFFDNHPELEEEYLGEYRSFIEDMRMFAHSEYCRGKDNNSVACRSAAKEEWKQPPLSYRIKRLYKETRDVLRNKRK